MLKHKRATILYYYPPHSLSLYLHFHSLKQTFHFTFIVCAIYYHFYSFTFTCFHCSDDRNLLPTLCLFFLRLAMRKFHTNFFNYLLKREKNILLVFVKVFLPQLEMYNPQRYAHCRIDHAAHNECVFHEIDNDMRVGRQSNWQEFDY